MSLSDYSTSFEQDILARAEANVDFTESVFVEIMGEVLIEAEEIDALEYGHYRHLQQGMRIDGYSLVPEENAINLFIADYRSGAEIKPITQKYFAGLCEKVKKFFNQALDKKFYSGLEESSAGFEVAKEIYDKQSQITKVKVYVLSNAEQGNNYRGLDSVSKNNVQFVFNLWSIDRLHRLYESGRPSESIVVDFKQLFDGESLPCLPANQGKDGDFQSYLLVVPGRVLAKLYDNFGQRLLEQNVRTFLQFRGNVNKGMKNTLNHNPDMFFAYNNGITATAEEVVLETKDNQLCISSIANLQIVNGGQTTAAIFTAMKKDAVNLDAVFVQMKLSVVPSDQVNTVVPEISEYANSQNKINAADFFANHDFHRRMEKFSRRIWVQSTLGEQSATHWYYERSRGQYGNAQSVLTPTEKKKFILQNPKNQMFVKTDLAKYVNSWDMNPYTVCLGAQKNFSKVAEIIEKQWTKDDVQFNELYFQELIAKAIIFRHLDKQIMKQDWYNGYKAQIVTYTIAYFRWLLEQSRCMVDLENIWKKQCIDDVLMTQLLQLAKQVNAFIIQGHENISNVSEWCKKKLCWSLMTDSVQAKLSLETRKLLLSRVDAADCHKAQQKEARKVQKVDKGIEAQIRLTTIPTDYWQQFIVWNRTHHVVDESVLRVTENFVRGRVVPNPKQAKSLLCALDTSIEEGFSEPPV